MTKQDKMKNAFKRLKTACLSGYCLLMAYLFAACSSDNEWPAGGDRVVLSPQIQMNGTATRSVIAGTAASPGENQINQVQMFVTRNTDGHTVYTPATNGLATFVLGSDNNWTSTPEVGLSADMARIFAFYPTFAAGEVAANFIPSITDDTHKIKVSIPANQTFDGSKSGACSTTDYLYGSASSIVGQASPITANNGKATTTKPFSPEISMQHALSYLVFYLETKSGRDLDRTNDYVKEIQLSTTDGTNQFRISGTSNAQSGMQIKDGTLTLTKSSTLKFTPTNGTAQLCGAAGSPALVAYGLVAPLTAAPSSLTLTVTLDTKGGSTATQRVLTSTFNTPKQWQKGNRYKYYLTLTDRDIVLTNISITPWGEGWTGSEDKGDDSLYPDGFK